MEEKKKQATTIDWDKLKIEFFSAEEKRISYFLKEKLNLKQINAFYKRKTKGWSEDKKLFLESTLQGATDDLKNKLKESYAVPLEQLNGLKKGIFDILFARLSQISDKVKIEMDPATGKQRVYITGEVPTKELIEILRVVKTELNEPTNINQSQLDDGDKEFYKEIGNITIK